MSTWVPSNPKIYNCHTPWGYPLATAWRRTCTLFPSFPTAPHHCQTCENIAHLWIATPHDPTATSSATTKTNLPQTQRENQKKLDTPKKNNNNSHPTHQRSGHPGRRTTTTSNLQEGIRRMRTVKEHKPLSSNSVAYNGTSAENSKGSRLDKWEYGILDACGTSLLLVLAFLSPCPVVFHWETSPVYSEV